MSGNGNGKQGKQGGKLRRFTTSLPFDQQENVEQYQAQLSETDQVGREAVGVCVVDGVWPVWEA